MKVNEVQVLHLAFLAKCAGKKCGYLEKKSGKRIVDLSTVKWQKRWCVLYYNFMFYYENDASQKPQGIIFLEGIDVSAVEVAEVPCFTIRVPGDEQREYLFGCSSIADQHEWINCITTSSANSIWERNNQLANTVQDLEHHMQSLKEENERLKKEINDHYSQVSRLKLELSNVRGQARGSRWNDRKTSITSTVTTIKYDGSSSNSTTVSDGEFTPEELVKLIKLQNAVRSWLLRRRWKGLIRSYINTFTTEKLKKRNKLLWQFITAEEDYVQQLNVLVNVFLHPMKQESINNKSLSGAEVNAIFINSELILVLHKLFVEGISIRMKNWPAIHIDDLLFALVAAVPIYIEYIKKHPEALKTLAECKKRSGFVKMLNWCEAKTECNGQTIEQFLLYPVRVMPTYVRNIYEILEVTPKEHTERQSLESILHKLQEAQTFNHYLDEGESIRHTLEIERLIDGGCNALLDGNQQFIRHGVLKQVSVEPRFPTGRREKIRHCFLFSQHLIVASRTVDGRLRLSKKSGIIPLLFTSLVEEEIGDDFPDYIKCRSFKLVVEIPVDDATETDRFDIILMANKSNEKSLWTIDIGQCIYNLALEEGLDVEDSKKEDPNEREGEGEDEEKKEEISPYALLLKDDRRLRENADDIEYSEEVSGPYQLPQIMHASVDRLIERLADPRLPGAEFMETFLLTYRAFTTSEVVLKGLIEAYWRVMGGYPTPKKVDSPERKKLAVSRSISSQGVRHRLRSVVSNTSDASSTDELDASFNSGVSPCTSTTVFNYHSLKDQLNSPAKRSIATNKWCEDSAAVTAKDNKIAPEDMKPRSASASNIAPMYAFDSSMETRKVSRSQSIEVLMNNKFESEGFEYQSAMNSKSCDRIDDIPFDDVTNKKVHILNIVNGEDTDVSLKGEPKKHLETPVIDESVKIDEFDGDTSLPNKHDQEKSINIADISSDVSTVFANNNVEEFSSSMLEDVAEEEDHHMDDETGSCGSAANSNVLMASIDSSFIDNERRDTLDSQITTDREDDSNTSTEKESQDDFNIDRSVTMDSVNSFASSEVSIDKSTDCESVTSKSLPYSHSDELICKQRSVSEVINLPTKSSSLSEKKSGISPYFRRKKKTKDEKKESKKSIMRSEVPSDEPVLLSIRENKDGRKVAAKSENLYGKDEPISKDNKEIMEVTSAPIPVPVLVDPRKPSPDNIPNRKRSLFQNAFRKFPVKRSSSEQNLSLPSPVTDMRPAISTMSLAVNGSAGLLNNKHSPSDNSLDYEIATRSLERKKNFSIRERFTNALTNSSSEVDLRPGMDGKNSLKKEKKKLRGSTLRILSASPKDSPTPMVNQPRRKSSVFESRPQMVTRKSISVNRGPLKIMSIFKHWIAKHPKDFLLDPEIIATADRFFDDIKKDNRTLPVVKEIVASLEKSLLSHRKSLATVHPFDELLLQQQSLRNTQNGGINEQDELNKCIALHHHPPSVVAENMTLLEHYLYSRISFNEFVSCQWTKKDKDIRAPGIMKFINRFNHVTQIISYGVVNGSTPKKRAELIEFWINTAAKCKDLNNFNACVEIVSALNASAVHRLKKSWELISRPFREIFDDLDSLVSAARSFKNLREAVHMCNPPCVPYLGSYLSDLLFAHEGGKTFSEKNLVNFAKMCRVSRLVREVKCYQQLPYTLELNQEVAFSLVNWDVEVDEDRLYEQSLLAEPRESSK